MEIQTVHKRHTKTLSLFFLVVVLERLTTTAPARIIARTSPFVVFSHDIISKKGKRNGKSGRTSLLQLNDSYKRV